MPPGIPVATVAINGAKNAGILAAQIASLKDSAIANRVDVYKKSLEVMVETKAKRLEVSGYDNYNSMI